MVETLPGYHLALAYVFMFLGCSIFDSPGLAALLRNFALEQPLWTQGGSV